MLVAENLIVGMWDKFTAGGDACVGFCLLDVWLQVEKLVALMDECFVEVDEECPWLLEDGTEIILQVFKEGGVEIACFQCIPMLSLPVGVAADAYVSHRAFPFFEGAAVNGNGQVQRSIGRVDGASVADGLLLIVLVLFNQNWFVSQKVDEPAYRRKVCAWKYHLTRCYLPR